ncbi:uncharacterized protein LOC141717209 [Apium graveolens]|uniref:uncharacterized protein LOC141717209 n=1 Tax=Apium graveolens TaxID=4045 RepID=UPI003D7B7760
MNVTEKKDTMYGPPEETLNPGEELDDTSDSASEMRYKYEFSSKQPKFKNANGEDEFPDKTTKYAALKVDRAVAAIECFCGTKDIIRGCGTIIESHHNKTLVLTSANLIRRPPIPLEYTGGKIAEEENVVANHLKVCMHSCNGKSFVGEVCAYDFHFNLAILSFRTGTFYEPATLAHVNDCMDVFATQPSLKPHSDSSKLTPSQPLLKPHSKSSKLTPGDRVIVVGRYFDPPFILMAAPGYYLLERTQYECKELSTTSCAIKRCGDGAPMVNVCGEVIGVSHYNIDSTQFTPINIARKWWEYYKKFGKYSRPSLGMEATNLYATPDLGLLENIFLKFPHVSRGVNSGEGYTRFVC